MHRTQISLEADQYKRLREESRRRGVSLSQILRELIDAGLCRAKPSRGKRADPLARITGIAAGTGERVGRDHDRILYARKRS